jgi:hypothetical protein
MTHVRITKKDDGGSHLFIDDMDLSEHIAAGLTIEYREDPVFPALVHITVLANTLKVD